MWYLHYKAKRDPCKWASDYNMADCFRGHVCLSKYCLYEDSLSCPLRHTHGVDPVHAHWIEALGEEIAYDRPSEAGSEEEEEETAEPFWI